MRSILNRVDCITVKNTLSRYQTIKINYSGKDIYVASQHRYKYLENTSLVCYPLYSDDVRLVVQQTCFWSYLQVGYCSKCREAEVFPA